MKLPLWEQGAELLHSACHELCIIHHAVPIGIQRSDGGVCLSRILEVSLGVKEGEQLTLANCILDALRCVTSCVDSHYPLHFRSVDETSSPEIGG